MYQVINKRGKDCIKVFLNERMDGGDRLGESNIDAWATDAEFQMGEGNPPTIELPASISVSGHTECYTVPDDGIDIIEECL